MKELEELVKKHGIIAVLQDLRLQAGRAFDENCATGTFVENTFWARMETVLYVALYAMQGVTKEEA